MIASGADVVLVSQGLDHIMRPLANHLGVERHPLQPPGFSRRHRDRTPARSRDSPARPVRETSTDAPDGQGRATKLLRDLGFAKKPDVLDDAIRPAQRAVAQASTCPWSTSIRTDRHMRPLLRARTLRGKQILLIGATGFIGKVWLANLLTELPEIGRVYLLIRGHRSATASSDSNAWFPNRPFSKSWRRDHGERFADFLRERVEVVDGDVSKPGLGPGAGGASAWRVRSTRSSIAPA